MIPMMDVAKSADAYSKAFQRLAALPGFSQREILLAEAGSILKAWAGRTKVATNEQIERRIRARVAYNLKMQKAGAGNPYGITVNNGARGGERGEVWFRTSRKRFQQAGVVTPGGKYKPANIHWKDADWQKIKAGADQYAARLSVRRREAKRAGGLARQSVIQIADRLGIDLATVKGAGVSAAGIAKARAAIASSGRAYQNGEGYTGGDEVKTYVDLINSLPYNTSIGMDRTLRGVLMGRAKYIERSYSKGAFDSMRKVAAAFPNITVKESAL